MTYHPKNGEKMYEEEFAPSIQTERVRPESLDRAPRIPEMTAHIREEVDALHKMLDELENRLILVLTPDGNEGKAVLNEPRGPMSEFGLDLMRYRDGIHTASNRIRYLLNRIDL